MSGFIVAAAQFPVSRPHSWSEFDEGLCAWVGEARRGGARLMVFPEYASMVLAALFDAHTQASLSAQLLAMQSLRDPYLDLHRRLARESGAYMLAGSMPWQLDDGRFVNRAWLCAPSGACGYQDKAVMTRFEREQWQMSAGEPQRVFRTDLGVLGIATCYDAEFPLLVRRQVAAGAELVLVPSCTDAPAGYHRVQVAARARALESQCPVVLSALVGEAAWSAAIDVNVGAAGIYGPPDRGYPDDGIIAQGELNAPGWVMAEIDPALSAQVRRDGQVLNWSHWSEQPADAAVGVVELGGH